MRFIDDFYMRVFPSIEYIEHVNDIETQKLRIDKIFHLVGGKDILVDEKKRKKDYGDILLEEWSNLERRKPGWLAKGKKTDYIMYIVVPAGVVHVLPFFILQSLWLRHYHEWKRQYGIKPAKNYAPSGEYLYTTTNIPVPTSILKKLISAELEIYV